MKLCASRPSQPDGPRQSFYACALKCATEIQLPLFPGLRNYTEGICVSLTALLK